MILILPLITCYKDSILEALVIGKYNAIAELVKLEMITMYKER